MAVVGPSGSGKTSLLMVMAGLERATGGKVAIAGAALDQLNEDQLAIVRRKNIGILFQNFHLIPSMTALENVALALEIAADDTPIADIKAQAAEALKSVGLGARLDHLPSALSGGEQQRVGLARAIVGQPKLLLADEPTGNLDQETAATAIDLLFAHAHADKTAMLLITHDMALARRADRVMRMDHGTLHEIDMVPS
ncbi:ABC transporter ATP-binding protein [Devosia algicola]|uniref:ABC transporter ATP-binding protein n=1 Tax=Devosia algicola TaxID=3026418 RepID=A0ABY7YNT3_9HYPH|nr:ABC transporter ATP-binding protein [Devosia algicola]WDR02847.1 ABC transporter ATP-binding protein [Devosia algicola]